MILQQIYVGNCVPNFTIIAISFIEDITKKTFWSLFFWIRCIAEMLRINGCSQKMYRYRSEAILNQCSAEPAPGPIRTVFITTKPSYLSKTLISRYMHH